MPIAKWNSRLTANQNDTRREAVGRRAEQAAEMPIPDLTLIVSDVLS